MNEPCGAQGFSIEAGPQRVKEAGLTAAVKHLTGLWTHGGTPNDLSASRSHYTRKQDL